MSKRSLIQTIEKLYEEFKPIGRYRFLMIDPRSHQIALDERFFSKIKALNCLDFHMKLTQQFKYQLIDTKTGREVFPLDDINHPHV